MGVSSTTNETHAPYGLVWGAIVLMYGKTTKTACGKRRPTDMLVDRGKQSCRACQIVIDAERAEYTELEATARGLGLVR